MSKLSLPGKLSAIELLHESRWSNEPVVLEKLQRWHTAFPHPAVKSAIFFYLARQGILRPERIMNDLHSDHLGLKAAAILTLKTSAHAFQFPSFCALASEKLRHMLDSKQEHEVCIALEILGLEKNPANCDLIFCFLKHPSPIVCRAAAKALSLSAHPDYKHLARPIIQHLSTTQDSVIRTYNLQALDKFADPQTVYPLILAALHFRPAERKLIEQIAVGLKENITPTLVQMVQDCRIADRCRLLAGKILGKLDRKILQKKLFDMIQKEIKRAYFYFYHAHSIQQQMPEQDLSILKKALLTGYQSIIDFIIQLLGIAGSLEECEILSHTLHSQNRKIRAQAIESLEKACDARLFSLLEPLIDERRPEERLRLYLKDGGIPLNLTQLLDAMAHFPSRADQIISLAMKAQLKTPDWRLMLQEKIESSEEIFHHFAHELLEGYA